MACHVYGKGAWKGITLSWVGVCASGLSQREQQLGPCPPQLRRISGMLRYWATLHGFLEDQQEYDDDNSEAGRPCNQGPPAHESDCTGSWPVSVMLS
mmetsp:Transcript_123442/g.214051  ORF Transcript_123442/g.214051 Transcript_123442/m.214051 type:complete len:97 (-) Transcript_123442:27-317(-)